MSDILNPLGGRFIGPSGPVATTSVLGTVADPPRGLLQVDPGTIIKGVVLGKESDGLTAIATDKGTVRVAANVPLPAGSQVTLEVRPTGDRLQVLILANDTTRLAQQAGSPTQQPTVAQAALQPSPTASGTVVSNADTRPAPTAPSVQAPTPPRPEPSIEFVGSSQRAVVVQAPPASIPTPEAAPVPTPPSVPAPPTVPGPVPATPVATPPIPPAPLPPASAPTPIPAPAPPSQAGSLPPAPVVLPSIPAPPPPSGTPVQVAPPSAEMPSPVPPQAPAPPPVPTSGQPQPTPPQTMPPGTSVPPAGGAVPLPTSPVIIGTPAPILVTPTAMSAAAVVSAATVQAALLAAGAEKKDRPTSAPPSAAVVAVAELEGAMSPALNDTPEQGQANTLPGGGMPLASSLATDAKQRILALFAAAGAMPDLDVEEIRPAVRAAGQGEPLPLGAELKLRVLAVQMQVGQQVAIDPIALDPQDARGQIIFGRVVSVTPAGHAVIHTPIGDIMLQNRSALMPGAQVALAIDTLETPAPPALPAPIVQTPQQALLTLSQGWPTLADIVFLLQGAGTGAARAEIDADTANQALAMLPHAGIRLGAGLMSAMAALRSGDLAKLIGPLLAAKGLGGDKEELLKRLKGEFTQLSALAQDRPEVDWRALFLPVINEQGRVTQINLFYRRPKKDSADAAERGSGTRFVVEADFSRLGPFQLDGLMRPQRFDLMVRSRQRLTDRMRREIEAIYEEARGLTGFAGSIAFQTVDEFPVIPLDDLKKGNPTYTV